MKDICSNCGKSEFYSYYAKSKIVRCLNCDLIFVSPKPSLKIISKYYSKVGQYDNWIDNITNLKILTIKRLNRTLNYKKSGKLLDVGAGIGNFLFYAKNYFEIYGTEISREAINIATNYYKLNLNFGYLEDQKLESNTYDVITLWHVLEHLHRPDLVIKECYRLLKNKGVLIIAVPNFNLVFSLLKSKAISIINHIFKKKYDTVYSPTMIKN